MKKLFLVIILLSIYFSTFSQELIFYSNEKVEYYNLFHCSNMDSISYLLQNIECQDSCVWHIKKVKKDDVPVSTPSFDFVLNEKTKLSLLLLDIDKNFIRIILNKEFEKGRFIIYLRDNMIPNSYLKTNTPFYFLIIKGNEYEYKKSIYMK